MHSGEHTIQRPTPVLTKFRKKFEREGLPWFILVSLLVHHAVLTIFFHPPEEPQQVEEEKQYEIITLSDYTPEVEEYVGPMVPVEEEALDREPDEDRLVAMKQKNRINKKEKLKKEEKKKEKKKEEKKEEKEVEELESDVEPFKGLHFVDIKNNKSDEPPKKAEYFAPINSKTDEETRAERTNLDHDDGASSPAESDFFDEETGDSDTQHAAHEVEPKDFVLQEKGNENKEESEELVTQTPEPSSSAPAKEETVSQDMQLEKFIVKPMPITPDNAPELDIHITENGQIVDSLTGEPLLSMTQFFNETKKKKKKTKSSGAEGGKGSGKEMDLAWTDVEGMFGKQMKKEKEAYEKAKKSQTKGGFTKNIDKVMSQLENFTPDVKPGNQTALNAAYHPFAEYITAFHRKLHPQWGDGYIAALMTKSSGHPHNDMNLLCKLEFVVDKDGSIGKVTVVKSSGDLSYDVAAIDAIYGGQPYPPPPDIIKSYNGKVYMRWGFYRDCNQCGVWLAEPYIIPAPASPIKKIKKPPKEIKK